jgi:hypothetical protein
MICPFCHAPIEPGERVYHEVLGWETERKQGGTNAIRLRQRTGQRAHWRCVDRAQHGLSGQSELFPA